MLGAVVPNSMAPEPTADDEIETGIETEARIDAEAVDVEPDVWAYADDGEYATTWAIERAVEDAARVEYHRQQDGVDGVDGPVETLPVHPDQHTDDFAREVAEADPEVAIEAARDYFDAEGDR